MMKMRLKSIVNNSVLTGFLLIAVLGSGQVKNVDRVIAVVGERPILYSEIETQRYQLINSGQDLGENARCIILEQLLFQNLLLTQADIDSVEVSEAQINAELENRIAYFERLIGGREKLEAEYGKSILEIKDEFYEQIEDKLRAQTVQRDITANVLVTPSQIKDFYNSLNKDSIPFIDAEVEFAHIIIKPKIDDSEKERLKQELNEYRQKIIDGTYKFASVASLISEDEGSRKLGGDLGFVRRGMLVPEFDAAAFSMKEGEITEPFETQFGIHVMQLIERRGDEYHARHILLIPKVGAEEMARAIDKLDSIVNAIKNGSITFEDAAAKYSEDEESKMNGGVILHPESGETKISVKALDATTFFLIDGMKVGEISKPSQYDSPSRETYFRIIKLNQRFAPHLATLDTDYSLVKRAAQANAEDEALEKWVGAKAKSTSVWIEDEFKTCEFDYQWLVNK